MTEARLDQVEAALHAADGDLTAIRSALAHLDPERATAELKAALRAPSPSDHHISTLRRRHETVNTLANQLEDLTRRIETTIADLETLAARTAQTMVAANDHHDPEAELDRLHIDIAALAAAHHELANLRPGPERNRP
jgi:hypothetical protein